MTKEELKEAVEDCLHEIEEERAQKEYELVRDKFLKQCEKDDRALKWTGIVGAIGTIAAIAYGYHNDFTFIETAIYVTVAWWGAVYLFKPSE